jgi:hypothetical protein
MFVALYRVVDIFGIFKLATDHVEIGGSRILEGIVDEAILGRAILLYEILLVYIPADCNDGRDQVTSPTDRYLWLAGRLKGQVQAVLLARV